MNYQTTPWGLSKEDREAHWHLRRVPARMFPGLHAAIAREYDVSTLIADGRLVALRVEGRASQGRNAWVTTMLALSGINAVQTALVPLWTWEADTLSPQPSRPTVGSR